MMIKLDENLGIRGKEILTDAGFDVTTVPEQNLSSASDDDLIKLCGREKRVLVTLDKDFAGIYTLSIETAAEHAVDTSPSNALPVL